MEEGQWLEKIGRPLGPVSRVAFLIVTGGDVFVQKGSQMRRKDKQLRQCLGACRSLELLKSWRFPGLDLDLLQLAVVCGNVLASYLLPGLGFSEGDRYRGSDLYENHPYHLSCFLGRSALYLPGIQAYIHLPGRVTIAVDSSTVTPDAPATRLEAPLIGTLVDLASRGGQLSCLKRLFADVLLVLKLRSVSLRDIETLWHILDAVYKSGRAPDFSRNVSHCVTESPLDKDFLLMGCQLLNGGSWTFTPSCSLDCFPLTQAIATAALRKRWDLLYLAATYCTQKQLRRIVKFLQDKNPPQPSGKNCCVHLSGRTHQIASDEREMIISVFETEQRERTLQQECALSILKSKGGDPRRFLERDALPLSLRSLFTVPFQGVYKKLSE